VPSPAEPASLVRDAARLHYRPGFYQIQTSIRYSVSPRPMVPQRFTRHMPSPVVQAAGVLWPRAAASAAIFRGSLVLIAERGNGPRKGSWSLPGGKIEPGETAASAVSREVLEETGLDGSIAGLLDVHDAIRFDAQGGVEMHYLICVFYGTSATGEPRAATDATDARFVSLDELADYRLTEGAVELIHEAHRRLGLSSP
jgi:8-oxo-dGTP diphosphatase